MGGGERAGGREGARRAEGGDRKTDEQKKYKGVGKAGLPHNTVKCVRRLS